jgi:hypothetical protein
MSFKPRHYLLIALLVGIFAYNYWRRAHQTQPAPQSTPVAVVPNSPPADTPAWRAFDHANSLRDAPAAQFAPALQALQQTQAATPSPGITGCVTWLEFYRQSMAQYGGPHRTDPQGAMHDRSLRHLTACTRYHADTTL